VLAHVNGHFPFMADEALEGCGLDRKYDVTTYLALMTSLQRKAKELGGLVLGLVNYTKLHHTYLALMT
jgi:hypothetical protein